MRICVGSFCREEDGAGPLKTQGEAGQGLEEFVLEGSAKQTSPTRVVETFVMTVPIRGETIVVRNSSGTIRKSL